MIHRHISDLTKKYSTSFYDLKTRLFFVRGLYLYLLIKIVLSWNASILVGKVITFEPIEYFPINWLFSLGNLFERAPVIFLVLGVVLSAVSILRPNYITRSILFWYMLNYFRVHY